MRSLFAITMLLAATQAAATDLVLHGGRIWTGDEANPAATAIAIDDGLVTAVGDDAGILALADAGTQRIDLGGRRVVPGINDAHVHLDATAAHERLDVPFPEPSAEQVLAALRSQPRDGQAPILATIGRAAFDDPRLRLQPLDDLHPTRPVLLLGSTGHGAVVNTAALRAWEIDPDAPIPGGWYGRDDAGRFDGRLHEYARWHVQRRMPAPEDAPATPAGLQREARELLKHGITSVQNMPLAGDPAAFAAAWASAGAPLRMRLVRFPMPKRLDDPLPGIDLPRDAGKRLVVHGTKWILDGTPVERDAALLAPYPGSTRAGRLNFGEADIAALLREANARGDQLLFHTSGDATVTALFDAMEAVAPTGTWRARRVRVEHGDGITPALRARAAALGVIVVQNPSHFAYPLADFAPLMRERGFQPLKDLLDAGIPLALGSDGPPNPWLNMMWAAAPGARPDQALTREQVLHAYTAGSAYAEFEEDGKGKLSPGYVADLAVLSQDVLDAAVPLQALPATTSLLTLVDGGIAWRDPAFAD